MKTLTELLKEVLDEEKKKADRCTRIARTKYDKPSAYRSGAIVKCRQGKIWKDLKEEEVVITEKESLHKWFSRNRKGGAGSSGAWVDCNTCRKDKNGNKKCKSCGRKKGETRSKYPSCRPTPGACKDKGKGEKWGKTK